MISKNLRRAMVEKGINQPELAEKSGVPQSTISGLLSGKVKAPRMDTLKKLADVLGVSVSHITGELSGLENLSPETRRVIDLFENMDESERLRAKLKRNIKTRGCGRFPPPLFLFFLTFTNQEQG